MKTAEAQNASITGRVEFETPPQVEYNTGRSKKFNRQIRKVKYSDGAVEIEFIETEGTREEERKLKSREAPRPELDAQLQQLKSDALKICELPQDYGKSLRVQSVSLSYKQGVMGATITMNKKLVETNSPLIINTPFLPSEPYDHGSQNTPTLPDNAVETIEALVEEAEKYIAGERAQLELEAEGERNAAR